MLLEDIRRSLFETTRGINASLESYIGSSSPILPELEPDRVGLALFFTLGVGLISGYVLIPACRDPITDPTFKKKVRTLFWMENNNDNMYLEYICTL